MQTTADYRRLQGYSRLQKHCAVHIPSLQVLQALQALQSTTGTTVVCCSLLQSAGVGPRFADVPLLLTPTMPRSSQAMSDQTNTQREKENYPRPRPRHRNPTEKVTNIRTFPFMTNKIFYMNYRRCRRSCCDRAS